MMHMNEKKRQEAIKRQLQRLDPDPAATSPQPDVFDPWEALELPLASYNGAVEVDILVVLEGLLAGRYNSDISDRSGMTESHVELIQYMLCESNVCDYGTSPRGCWIVHGLKNDVEALANRWRSIVDSWG